MSRDAAQNPVLSLGRSAAFIAAQRSSDSFGLPSDTRSFYFQLLVSYRILVVQIPHISFLVYCNLPFSARHICECSPQQNGTNELRKYV